MFLDLLPEFREAAASLRFKSDRDCKFVTSVEENIGAALTEVRGFLQVSNTLPCDAYQVKS